MSRAEDETAYQAAWFTEIVESDSDVDLASLRMASQFGVPRACRGAVWMYLLGVVVPDKSEEMRSAQKRREHFTRLLHTSAEDVFVSQRIQNDALMWARRHRLDPNKAIQHVVRVFLETRAPLAYSNLLVDLAAPMCLAIVEESDAYFAFCRLMDVRQHMIGPRLETTRARLIMLLRTFCPDVCAYFDDEGVPFTEWTSAWLESMLATALHVSDCLRLWDAYFSRRDDTSLHLFVCVAIVQRLGESLSQLDYSEIKVFLRRLPRLDMRWVLVQADTLQQETAVLGL